MRTTLQFPKTTLLDLIDPTDEELQKLREEFRIRLADMETVLTGPHRPELSANTRYIFLAFNVPVEQEQAGASKIFIHEVDFFIFPNTLAILRRQEIPPLERLLGRWKESPETLKDFGPDYLLFRIINALNIYMVPVVKRLGATIESLDQEIFFARPQKILNELSNLRRNLVLLHTSIRPSISIFQTIANQKVPGFSPRFRARWEDVLIHYHTVFDQIEDYRELIEGLAIANETLISFRTNEVIKILTYFSLIFLPPTLLASIYGMNVPLPFAHRGEIFFALLAIMGASIFALHLFFKKRGWL